MLDSLYSADYFEKELRKKKQKIRDLEEKLLEERENYRKLIWKKAGWEIRLAKIIDQSTRINVEL